MTEDGANTSIKAGAWKSLDRRKPEELGWGGCSSWLTAWPWANPSPFHTSASPSVNWREWHWIPFQGRCEGESLQPKIQWLKMCNRDLCNCFPNRQPCYYLGRSLGKGLRCSPSKKQKIFPEAITNQSAAKDWKAPVLELLCAKAGTALPHHSAGCQGHMI